MQDGWRDTADREITTLRERAHDHGDLLQQHEVKLDMHGRELGQLWNKKVSVERYIWVERIVVGGAGAVLFYVLQMVLHR